MGNQSIGWRRLPMPSTPGDPPDHIQFGPRPTYFDVRDLVVIRGKADVTRTSRFGRE
jgi:hypothetical protein